MAGASAIFRVTTTGQNESTAPEKIEFDGGATPDQTGEHVETRLIMRRHVNPHPNPGSVKTDWHDNKLGFTELILTGSFTDKSNTTGPQQFFDWQKEDAINDDFPKGRFGVRIDDYGNGVANLVPVAADGYILHHFELVAPERPRGVLRFIARLYRSGTIST